MKKLLLMLLVVGILVGGYLFYKKEQAKDSDESMVVSPKTTPAPSAATSTYKDGSYTSDVVQTDRGFGPIQVKVMVSGGKITDVQFLQFPNKPGHTTEVSDMALPVLKQEAITAQSAQVDNVSGATQTTDAFKQALSSVLAMAK